MAAHLTRIQLCGQLVARVAGRRLDAELPGRQGRLAFAYLVLNRHRVVTRSALVEALWPDAPPAGADSALSAVLSKIRKTVDPGRLEGRGDVRLVLPDACVDVEAAAEAIHRAEATIARGSWAEAWGPARVALHIVRREFLPGESALWVEEKRDQHGEIELRALECIGAASLALGPPELDAAVRSGRDLVRLAPHRESGHRLLMRALVTQGNDAEALLVYESLRVRLREDLGVAPSAQSQELHRTLLG